jgi:type II secretory ATPase GspE/PulE/Tfp pilus assembly ATPase PilB-like protein
MVRLDASDFAVRIRRLGSFGAEDARAPDGEAEDLGLGDAADGEPVVNYLDSLLLDAARRGASDVHIEWGRPRARVRSGSTASCARSRAFPHPLPRRVIPLKLLAGLDIVERRLPQDGRIPLEGPEGRLDIRASFVPAARGESIVLRILPATVPCARRRTWHGAQPAGLAPGHV